MRLKTKIKEILHEPANIGLMMHKLNKSYPTLRRWLDFNSDKLTQKKVIEVICEITGVKEDDLFELEKSNIR